MTTAAGVVFFGVFVIFSIIYCFLVIKGLQFSRARGLVDVIGYLTLGVQSKNDVNRYLDTAVADKAIFALRVRNWSLLLFLIVSVIDFMFKTSS